jgi:hypothetical protein
VVKKLPAIEAAEGGDHFSWVSIAALLILVLVGLAVPNLYRLIFSEPKRPAIYIKKRADAEKEHENLRRSLSECGQAERYECQRVEDRMVCSCWGYRHMSREQYLDAKAAGMNVKLVSVNDGGAVVLMRRVVEP